MDRLTPDGPEERTTDPAPTAPRSRSRPWTPEEDAAILGAPGATAAELAALLGRSVPAVHQRRHRLGATRGGGARRPRPLVPSLAAAPTPASPAPLRAVRRWRGLTRGRLAAEAGVEPRALRRIEEGHLPMEAEVGGHAAPGPGSLATRVAAALGVAPEAIAEFRPPPAAVDDVEAAG